jgi:hypothetical protein
MHCEFLVILTTINIEFAAGRISIYVKTSCILLQKIRHGATISRYPYRRCGALLVFFVCNLSVHSYSLAFEIETSQIHLNIVKIK